MGEGHQRPHDERKTGLGYCWHRADAQFVLWCGAVLNSERCAALCCCAVPNSSSTPGWPAMHTHHVGYCRLLLCLWLLRPEPAALCTFAAKVPALAVYTLAPPPPPPPPPPPHMCTHPPIMGMHAKPPAGNPLLCARFPTSVYCKARLLAAGVHGSVLPAPNKSRLPDCCLFPASLSPSLTQHSPTSLLFSNWKHQAYGDYGKCA